MILLGSVMTSFWPAHPDKGSSNFLIDHPSPGKGDIQQATAGFQGLEAIGDWEGQITRKTPPKLAIGAPNNGL
jgi:hypothetical protein